MEPPAGYSSVHQLMTGMHSQAYEYHALHGRGGGGIKVEYVCRLVLPGALVWVLEINCLYCLFQATGEE